MKNSKKYPVEMMCRVFEVSKSGYYAWRKRPKSVRELENKMLSDEIRIIFAKSNESYGSPRITQQLKEAGKSVSRPRVAVRKPSASVTGTPRLAEPVQRGALQRGGVA